MQLEILKEFERDNQSLLDYEKVISKTQKKLSFSIFRILRNEILAKINETNFVFAFEFDIIVLTESLLFLTTKGLIEIPYSESHKIDIIDKDFVIKYEEGTILVGSKEKRNFFRKFLEHIKHSVIQIDKNQNAEKSEENLKNKPKANTDSTVPNFEENGKSAARKRLGKIVTFNIDDYQYIKDSKDNVITNFLKNNTRNTRDEEEIIVYRDLFQSLVNQIKEYFSQNFNFITFSDENKYKLQSYGIDQEVLIMSKWSFERKTLGQHEILNINNAPNFTGSAAINNFNSGPLVTVEFPKQNLSEKSDREFSIDIELQLQTKNEKGENKITQKFINIIHIQPKDVDINTKYGFTRVYGDSVQKAIENSFYGFYKFINEPNAKLYSEFDIVDVVLNLENIVNNFHEDVKKEYSKRRQHLDESKKVYLNKLLSETGEINNLADSESLKKLMIKNQLSIAELDKTYIHKFVKLASYLNTKKSNIETICNIINKTSNIKELGVIVNLIENQIYLHNLLVFHSLSMLGALIDNDLITFYEIYECFDKLSVFNSNWENDVTEKLTEIGAGLQDLLYTTHKLERNIVSAINNLTYVSQEGFARLGSKITNELSSINSSIKFNSLLTSLQTFKLYNP